MSNAVLTEFMLKQEGARIWSEYAPKYESEFKLHFGHTPETDQYVIRATFRDRYTDYPSQSASDLLMSLNDFSKRILRPMINALAQSVNLIHPLRDLAYQIEALAQQHPAYSQAQSIIQNCVSHLSAVARVHECNMELIRKELK